MSLFNCIIMLLLYVVTLAIASQQVLSAKDEFLCPIDVPYSCSNSTPVENSCCFESPGGILLQTQFWDYHPPIGGNETFTLHGLWPDNCDGTYEQFCNDDMETSNVGLIVEGFDKQLFQDMSTYWKDYQGNDKSLWNHEFNKHGTCVKTLYPKCYQDYEEHENVYDYVRITMELYKSLNTFEFLKAEGIVPSTEATYTKKQIDDALTKHFGQQVYFKCNKYKGLQEVWYYHYIKGSLRGQDFKPIDTLTSSNCPSEGIKFFPKGSTSSPTNPPGGGDGGDGNVKKAFLNVKDGCLISNGKYFTKGTCATYRISKAQFGGYNLRSSKGLCGVVDNKIVCNGASKSGTQFQVKDGVVGYNNKFKWCITGSNDQQDVSLGDCDESYEISVGYL